LLMNVTFISKERVTEKGTIVAPLAVAYA
jgi:hypothetical protein